VDLLQGVDSRKLRLAVGSSAVVTVFLLIGYLFVPRADLDDRSALATIFDPTRVDRKVAQQYQKQCVIDGQVAYGVSVGWECVNRGGQITFAEKPATGYTLTKGKDVRDVGSLLLRDLPALGGLLLLIGASPIIGVVVFNMASRSASRIIPDNQSSAARRQSAEGIPSGGQFCAVCGASVSPTDNFCVACGNRTRREARRDVTSQTAVGSPPDVGAVRAPLSSVDASAPRPMTFGESVRHCFVNYANFRGRASRSEYWWFVSLYPFSVAILWLHGVLFVDNRSASDADLERHSFLLIVVMLLILAMIIPGMAAGVRRLHDTGRSAYSLLVNLLPVVGGLIVLVWLCQAGQPGDNKYGPARE